MTDQLSTTRFRRVLRPLLAKIHVLNDLYSKDPLSFDFDISKINKNHKSNKNINEFPHHQQPQQRQHTTKRPRLGEEPIPDFYNPIDSEDRLKSLRSFITPELYKSYTELFQIVKSILTLLTPKQKEYKWKLSSLCAFEIGKEMAESIRTTYYRLNNVSLFDPSLMNQVIKELNQELYEDLDDWMKEEMEPKLITQNYTREVFAGYIIRLIVIHSQTTLYMFVPVLMHWLLLQGTFLKKMGTFLSHEYFKFPDVSTTNVEELNGLPFNDTLLVFWSLYTVDYWTPFMSKHHLLDILPYKISLEIFEELEIVHRLLSGYYREQVYGIYKYEKKNTNIIVMMMVKIFQKARKKLTSYDEAYSHFKEIYRLLLEVVRNWLPYYNRTFNNNNVVFHSLRKLRQYTDGKLLVLSQQKEQYMKLYINFKGLFDTVDIIGHYYMDPMSSHPKLSSSDKIAKIAVKLGFDNADFLYWLYEQ